MTTLRLEGEAPRQGACSQQRVRDVSIRTRIQIQSTRTRATSLTTEILDTRANRWHRRCELGRSAAGDLRVHPVIAFQSHSSGRQTRRPYIGF